MVLTISDQVRITSEFRGNVSAKHKCETGWELRLQHGPAIAPDSRTAVARRWYRPQELNERLMLAFDTFDQLVLRLESHD